MSFNNVRASGIAQPQADPQLRRAGLPDHRRRRQHGLVHRPPRLRPVARPAVGQHHDHPADQPPHHRRRPARPTPPTTSPPPTGNLARGPAGHRDQPGRRLRPGQRRRRQREHLLGERQQRLPAVAHRRPRPDPAGRRGSCSSCRRRPPGPPAPRRCRCSARTDGSTYSARSRRRAGYTFNPSSGNTATVTVPRDDAALPAADLHRQHRLARRPALRVRGLHLLSTAGRAASHRPSPSPLLSETAPPEKARSHMSRFRRMIAAAAVATGRRRRPHPRTPPQPSPPAPTWPPARPFSASSFTDVYPPATRATATPAPTGRATTTPSRSGCRSTSAPRQRQPGHPQAAAGHRLGDPHRDPRRAGQHQRLALQRPQGQRRATRSTRPRATP